MSRKIATLVIIGMAFGVVRANAQESNTAPPAVEVTLMPAVAAYFTAEGDSPSFANYGYGTAVTFNLSPFAAIEGEVGSTIATTSELHLGDLSSDVKAPNMLNYTANVIVSAPMGGAVAPYAAMGVGGLTMFERPALGVLSDETFLTVSVGAGIKWRAANGRWGLRGDYRFAIAQAEDDAPAFVGRVHRSAHRVYGGVTISARR